MSGEDEDEDLNFPPGHVVETSKSRYTVLKLLGEGGFGAVYLVSNKEGTKAAMKVERKNTRRKDSKLKMEIAILKAITESKHFTRIMDRGKHEQGTLDAHYFYLVMELVGKNLQDLRNGCVGKFFSFGTGLGVADQCLEAIKELHQNGFIHRDIKPHNYACGLGPQKHTIFILDFGIARKYMNKNSEIKTPREKVGFKGTVPFAPLACHRGVEMAPKDDCESWFYLLIDLTLPGHLPWRKMSERSAVFLAKQNARTDGSLFVDLKQTTELSKILHYLDMLEYHDKVDYDFIHMNLVEACRAVGVGIDDPYDWEMPQKSMAEKTAVETPKGDKRTDTDPKRSLSDNRKTDKEKAKGGDEVRKKAVK